MSKAIVGRWRSYKIVLSDITKKDDTRLYKFNADGTVEFAVQKGTGWHVSPRKMVWNIINDSIIVDPYNSGDVDDYEKVEIIAPDEISIESIGVKHLYRKL